MGTMEHFDLRPPNTGSWVYPPVANLSTTLPDETAPTQWRIFCNNTTNTLANPGDDVSLTFTASEAIDTPVVTFKYLAEEPWG